MFLRRRQWNELWEALTEGSGCFVTLFGFLIFVAFLAAVGRVLTRVAPENRRMEPGQVWLNLIPVVNLVWLPVTIDRVGESIRNEFLARGLNRPGEKYGKSAGLTALFLGWFGLFLLPVGVVLLILGLIYGGVYWALLGIYGRRLQDADGGGAPPADEGW